MAYHHNGETRQEKVKKACGIIDKHVHVLVEQMQQGKSDQLIRYLEFTAQFHQYSFRNIMLALSQKGDISRLAGLKQWNKLGRHVRQGEHGIMILAPMILKSKDSDQTGERENDEESTIIYFRPVYVFDVSQTNGADLPELVHAQGDVSSIYPRLQEAVREAGIELEYLDVIPVAPSAEGVSMKGRIILRRDLPEPEAFRTLAHEYAHELLHWQGDKESKTIRETEADAVAFVVCRHFGVECDSSDYLLMYDSDPQVLLGRLESIRQTAATIIGHIDPATEGSEEPEMPEALPA